MVYINLLPIREIKKRIKAVQELTLAGFVFAGVLIALGAFWYYQSNIIEGLNTDIANLKKEKQKYEEILKQIAKLEADKKLIESKIAVIKQLQKTKAITVHILDEVAKLTPSERVWITSLKQNGLSLVLNAMALDNQTIASYMNSLKTSDYIQDVNLVGTQQSGYAGRDLKSFSLNVSLKLPSEDEELKNNSAKN